MWQYVFNIIWVNNVKLFLKISCFTIETDLIRAETAFFSYFIDVLSKVYSERPKTEQSVWQTDKKAFGSFDCSDCSFFSLS